MFGGQIGEFRGRVTGRRVLSDGKIETSEEGSGKILGVDASWSATAVSKRMQSGVVMAEGDGVVTTVDGEVVLIRKIGIGRASGAGWKASRRGVFFHTTQSPKLIQLNSVVGVWEFESEEDGNWHVVVWEWK
jgi:hypothetical protein